MKQPCCQTWKYWVKGAVPCCSESCQSSRSEEPGIHAEGVMNLAPTVGGRLSSWRWNSTACGQHLKKTLLKIVSAASASNASLNLCSKYPKGLNENSGILLIYLHLFSFSASVPEIKQNEIITHMCCFLCHQSQFIFQVISMDTQGSDPQVP